MTCSTTRNNLHSPGLFVYKSLAITICTMSAKIKQTTTWWKVTNFLWYMYYVITACGTLSSFFSSREWGLNWLLPPSALPFYMMLPDKCCLTFASIRQLPPMFILVHLPPVKCCLAITSMELCLLTDFCLPGELCYKMTFASQDFNLLSDFCLP